MNSNAVTLLLQSEALVFGVGPVSAVPIGQTFCEKSERFENFLRIFRPTSESRQQLRTFTCK